MLPKYVPTIMIIYSKSYYTWYIVRILTTIVRFCLCTQRTKLQLGISRYTTVLHSGCKWNSSSKQGIRVAKSNKQVYPFVDDHVRIKIKYEIRSYIGSLTTVCRSGACYDMYVDTDF